MPLTRVQPGLLEATGTASSSTFLRGDGAWATPNTITSGTAVSASGTSVDFTGIPATAKRITVMFSVVSTNGSSKYLIQLGDSGGVETTGYDSSGSYVSSGADTAVSTAGFILNSQNSGQAYSGTMTINSFVSNTWVSSHAMGFSGGASIFGGGTKTLSATLDRVRITTVNGTDAFDAGTINILVE
jgi:hypothetical protein